MKVPTALQLTCPPLHKVRIGLIGLGQRGMKTLERYAYIANAEITYLADVFPDKLAEANRKLAETGRACARCACGENGWAEVCKAKDLDLVYICTEWRSHTPIAVFAMQEGKHVAIEVPAATTVEECWQLVHTAEATRRHCFMTENCCYDLFAQQTQKIVQNGELGTLQHLEGAYIHQLDKPGNTNERHEWMVRACAQHGGNPYPTHAIGPIAQLLKLHREDWLDSLVSMTSRTATGEASESRQNCTLLRTRNGVTILLELDVTTPRPYSRLQTVCGSKGFVQKYPLPTLQIGETCYIGEEATQRMKAYGTSQAAHFWRKGHEMGVPNEMNYAMDARLTKCLCEGWPLDIDVYDAAEWSCIAELSRQSAIHGGMPVAVPDFLHGE